MKSIVIAAAVVSVLAAGQVGAGCVETTGANGWKKMKATGNPAITSLGGKTVCVAKSGGGWDAQEYHQGTSSGSLIDYKRGPSHPVDPTSTVGNWSISGDQITHNYGAGGSYTWDVYTDGINYSFCTGATERALATVKAGQASC